MRLFICIFTQPVSLYCTLSECHSVFSMDFRVQSPGKDFLVPRLSRIPTSSFLSFQTPQTSRMIVMDPFAANNEPQATPLPSHKTIGKKRMKKLAKSRLATQPQNVCSKKNVKKLHQEIVEWKSKYESEKEKRIK